MVERGTERERRPEAPGERPHEASGQWQGRVEGGFLSLSFVWGVGQLGSWTGTRPLPGSSRCWSRVADLLPSGLWREWVGMAEMGGAGAAAWGSEAGMVGDGGW